MSMKNNRAIVKRIFDEVANNKQLDVIGELFSKQYIFHQANGQDINGPEGFHRMVSMSHNAFPDYRITVEDMIAEDEKVTCRFTASGTHRGELMGMSATGKAFTAAGIAIYRIVDSQVVEQWENFDVLGMLQQIGVVPA